MDYYQEIYEYVVFGNPLPSPGKEVIQNMKLIDKALEKCRIRTDNNFLIKILFLIEVN